MVDTYEEANALADALESIDEFDVVDTLVGRSGQPSSVVIGVEDLKIEGVTFDKAELIVDVTKTGPTVDMVEVYDEPDHRLSDEETEVIESVCGDRYPDPEITLYEYSPNGTAENVDSVEEHITDVYDANVEVAAEN